MGALPPRRIPVRRERLNGYWIAWLLLAAFIAAGSAGHWAPYQPGIWAPMLLNPADITRNIALYVPFGFFGMRALGRADARGVLRVATIAVIFSLGVESLQLYTSDRVASLTDIASAALGSIAGASAVAWAFSAR
jgi:glycopeptide antibiotics resistance protein